MVFGFGEGKIEIKTERESYKKGEKLKGKVILNLPKPRNAKGLRIVIYSTHLSPKGADTIDFTQKKMLDKEKEYPSGQTIYPFEFDIPRRPCQFWYLEAALDIPMVPMMFGVSKTQFLEIK